MGVAGIDDNSRQTLTALSNVDGVTIVPLWADPVTHRLLTSSVSTANLIIGTSTITSGTTGLLLYDNAGVVGELPLATYPSLTELSYVKGVTSAIQSQLNAKGAGTVTAVSIVSANGVSGTSGGGTTPALTIALGAITPTSITGQVAGAALTIKPSASSGATGASMNIWGGDAGGAGDNNGGNIVLITGNKTGAGVSGKIRCVTGGNTFGGLLDFSGISASDKIITFQNASDTVVCLATTDTLTNKRVTPRILSAASYTTNTGTSINGDTQDMFIVTAQTGALKFNNPTGTPTDGQKLIISVASSTTAARALTWDTAYGATTIDLPTITSATTATLTIGFIWSASKSLWQVVAVA